MLAHPGTLDAGGPGKPPCSSKVALQRAERSWGAPPFSCATTDFAIGKPELAKTCSVPRHHAILPLVPHWDAGVGMKLQVDRNQLAEFCRRHGIRKLALFGSVLRDDFGPDSDVDVLVEFEPGRTPGFAFFALQDELAEMLGRRVDLQTPGFLSPHFRAAVLRDAEVLHVAA